MGQHQGSIQGSILSASISRRRRIVRRGRRISLWRWRGRRRNGRLEAWHLITLRVHALRIGEIIPPLDAILTGLG